MIDEKPAEVKRVWGKVGPAEAWRWQQSETPLTRFLGGTPANVVLRLFFLSLLVGALLMWLDITPTDVIQGVVNFFRRMWALGFASVRDLGNYLLAGAVIVVPIWLVLRLANMRATR